MRTPTLGRWARVTAGEHAGLVGQLERGPWPDGKWTVVPVKGRLEHVHSDDFDVIPDPRRKRRPPVVGQAVRFVAGNFPIGKVGQVTEVSRDAAVVERAGVRYFVAWSQIEDAENKGDQA